MATAKLKTNYSVEKRFEAFFTGGAVALNRNGNWLFTTCGNVINVIDIKSGALLAVIGSPQSDDDVTYFCVRTKDDSVFVAYRNLLVKHYSVEEIQHEKIDDGSPATIHTRSMRTWKSNHRAQIILMEFSSDDRLLATGGSDSLVKIWDLELQYCVFTLRGATGIINCLYFDSVSSEKSSSNRIFYGGDDGRVLCWDLKENCLLATCDLHTSAVRTVITLGDAIYTAGRDSVIGIWDRHTMALRKTIPVFENLESLIVTSSDDGDTVLISGGDKGMVKVWNPSSGNCVLSSVAFGSVIKQMSLCQTDQHQYLIAVTEDHVIYLLKPSDLSTTKHFVGYNDEILDTAFLTDDLLAVASNSKDIRIYNTATGDCRLVNGHTDIVMCVDAASWCTGVFASGSKDNNLRIWRIGEHEAECVSLATGHTNSITAVRFSRTKPHFVASVSHDTTLKIWKLPAGLAESTDASSEHKQPDRLASASTVAGHEKDVTCVDISPNDKLVATGSMDKTVKLWHLNQKTLSTSLAGTITGHKRGVWDVRFSPVLQVLATASGDWTVKLFSLDDFSCVTTLEGHQTTALRVRFLPSGLQLFSTDSSGLLKLWNIKTGECAKTFDEHTKALWALELTEGGSKILTGGSDSKLQIWKDVTEEERETDQKKSAQSIAEEQALANLVDQKKFTKALRLAIRLCRPYNALKIMKNMHQRGQDEELAVALRSVSIDNTGVLLDWICEWNTSTQNCHVAQKVLTIILRQHTPENLTKLPNIKEAIEALLPYSERHFDRLGRLRQKAAFAEYSWQCMRLTGRNDDGVLDKAIKDEILHD